MPKVTKKKNCIILGSPQLSCIPQAVSTIALSFSNNTPPNIVEVGVPTSDTVTVRKGETMQSFDSHRLGFHSNLKIEILLLSRWVQ